MFHRKHLASIYANGREMRIHDQKVHTASSLRVGLPKKKFQGLVPHLLVINAWKPDGWQGFADAKRSGPIYKGLFEDMKM